MIELQEHNGKLKVENYGLMEWATDVQSAVQQGYEIDTSNEGYPQNFGSLYTCLMVKTDVLPDKQAETPLVLPVDEAKDVLVIAPFDGTLPTTIEPKEVSTLVSDQKQESVDIHKEFLKDNAPDADQPAKRGPKPKNK